MVGGGRRLDNDRCWVSAARKLDRKVTEALSDDEIKLLLKACAGKDFIDNAMRAIVRLMIETGCSAGE